MKRSTAGLSLVLASFFGILGCNRVSMEMSPEALKAYGVPSQQSNSEPAKDEKVKAKAELSYFDSSAIVPKLRPH